ncbi:fused (3R)-hydroxyacyl-ACP dehydratase subunits HadA/HadB [Nocardia higoensis]|uniref:fused (3R)-hydroxyacyl-ACP dehydratase subunits HadA/HadB n=1 Tax=Nocardia higoensis TaxID=228599 RepID=UPI0005947A6A
MGAHSQSLVGHHYRLDDYYEVGREKIREYARAVQDYHPAHWQEKAAAELGYTGLVTPPTFFSIPAMLANRRLFESVVKGYDVYVQTDQVFEWYHPVVAGDRLTSDVELSSVRRIAGKDLLTVTNTFTDQAGSVVQVMHTTVVGITAEEVDPGIGDAMKTVIMHGLDVDAPATTVAEGVRSPAEDGSLSTRFAAPRAPHTAVRFDEVAVGDALPPRTVTLTRGDLVNYAGVAGDANPIHWNERIATLAGLPDVIAHGMLTMACGAGFVTDWLGDPGALAKYTVRLSNYTVVEADSVGIVEYTGKIKSVDPESRTAVVLITAKSVGRKIFGLATAEVRLS